MAFTFQVNSDKFIHDEKLLAKAESYRPKIHKAVVKPVRLFDDERDISRLGEYGLKRDDKIILDFGRHIVGKFSVDIAKTGSPQDAPLYMHIKFAEMPADFRRKARIMTAGCPGAGFRKNLYTSTNCQ